MPNVKKCDIIIPVWNELESTKKCVEALKEHTRYPYRLIIVDNASDRPTREYLDGLREVFQDFLLIRNNTNLGFVKAVNQGMVSSDNSYMCLLRFFVILKLRERLKKKAAGILLAEDANDEGFFKKLNFIHKAAVLSGKKERVLNFCDKKSREA